MKFAYYNRNKLSTIIHVDYKLKKVTIENYTDNLIDRAFGVNEHPTMDDFNAFLESRCIPRTRDKIKIFLDELGIDYYDPLEIIRKTQGRMAEDHMWLQICEE